VTQRPHQQRERLRWPAFTVSHKQTFKTTILLADSIFPNDGSVARAPSWRLVWIPPSPETWHKEVLHLVKSAHLFGEGRALDPIWKIISRSCPRTIMSPSCRHLTWDSSVRRFQHHCVCAISTCDNLLVGCQQFRPKAYTSRHFHYGQKTALAVVIIARRLRHYFSELYCHHNVWPPH